MPAGESLYMTLAFLRASQMTSWTAKRSLTPVRCRRGNAAPVPARPIARDECDL